MQIIEKVTIANAGSLSGAADLEGKAIAGIVMPADWTAAALTFQVSVDGTNFKNLYNDSGSEVSITVAADTFIRLTAEWKGIRYIKVRSGTAGVPVAQGAERQIGLVCID
jgi:hypothetical protein